jgi:4-amino-4-deoxy-L-arabinose transferase-like glycosyltransferase
MRLSFDSQKRKIIISLFFILFLATVLRFWNLGIVPPGLFGDEADTGYQAYSILKTGRDYFGNLLPIHFQSYGDWRVPLYIYLDSFFVGFWGLNEIAVRLPAAIIGILAVLVSFFLGRTIGKDEKIGLMTAFLVAISPWHLHFSRAAFEAILLTFLFPLAIIIFLKGLELKNKYHFFIAAFILGLTPYAYNTPKLFLPIIILALLVLFRKELLSQKRKTAVFLVVLGFVLLPIVIDVFRGPGIARFNSLSILNDESIPERVRLAREASSLPASAQRLLYNKVGFWTQDFLDNYLSSFSTQFLFIRGDPSPRQSAGGRGELYLFELPFLLIGLAVFCFQALKKRNKFAQLTLLFILLTPIPAALTQGGGEHAIRLLAMIPWFQLMIASGIVYFSQKFIKKKWRKVFWPSLFLVAFFSFFLFILNYFDQYPKVSGRWWNFGYREVFDYVNQVEDQYDQIYISSSWEPSLVYTLFYSQFSPQEAQKELTISPSRVGKYWFLSPDITRLKRGEGDARTLYVLNPAELEIYGLELKDNPFLVKIKDIPAPDGTGAFVIFSSRDKEE